MGKAIRAENDAKDFSLAASVFAAPLYSTS